MIKPRQGGEADIIAASEDLLPQAGIGFRDMIVVTILDDEHGQGMGGRRSHGVVAPGTVEVLC